MNDYAKYAELVNSIEDVLESPRETNRHNCVAKMDAISNLITKSDTNLNEDMIAHLIVEAFIQGQKEPV